MAIQAGKRYRITNRMHRYETTFTATINNVEQRHDEKRDLDFEYFGYTPDDIRQGRFGYARYYGEGCQPYGVVKMEEIK